MADSKEMIRAEVHTDDYVNTAKFNATKFFESVNLDDIVQLELCDWGSDYSTDNVAIFFDGMTGFEGVTRVFENTTRRRQGFECHVHRPDAMQWLHRHRPEIFMKFSDSIGVSPRELLTDEGEPFWDSEPEWAGEYNDANSAAKAMTVDA